MIRRSTASVVVLIAILLLAACAQPADPAAIAEKATPAGIAPQLVYVIDVDGFEPAPQSVGVMGDDGMSTMYVSHGAGVVGMIMLTTSHTADPALAPCDEVTEPAGACVVEVGDAAVMLEAADVDADTLRAAAKSVRTPTEGELETLFAEVEDAAPGERGDLPETGDGAPVDPPGAGG